MSKKHFAITVMEKNLALLSLTSNLGAVWLPVNQIYKTLYDKLSTQKDEQNQTK